MAISISSTSTVHEYDVEIPSPTPIMKDIATFFPLLPMVAKEFAPAPEISHVRLQLDPPGMSKRKQFAP